MGPSNKSLNCLLGQVESCDNNELVIGHEPDTNKFFSTRSYSLKPVVKTDYKDYLVPTVNIGTCDNKNNEQSDGYDTDDLIEDAKNFVKVADTKLVGIEDWKEIDEQRRKRRLTRRERDK